MCKRIFKEETTTEGEIPFYKIGTFGSSPDAFISRQLFEEYKAKFSYPKPGAILLSASGTIGRIVEYKGEEAYFQDSNIVWLSHDKSVSNKFLKVLYPTVKWDGIEGSTIQRLYNDNFLKTGFKMPGLPEQEKIGEFFEGIDNLITLHQCKHYQDHSSVFAPQNASDITSFTATWEQRKLGDIVDRVTRKNSNNESELPLTISAQYGLIDQMEFFGKRIASRDISGYYLLLKGEFAYNKSTSGDAPWGAVKRLDRYENGAVSTLYITFAIRDSEQTDSDFLACYYDTDLWHKGVQSVAAEGARNHGLLNIAPADFFNTTLMVPRNIEEQKAVGSILNKVDNLITLHQCKHYQDHSSVFAPQNASDITSFTATWEQRKFGDIGSVCLHRFPTDTQTAVHGKLDRFSWEY